MKHIKILVFGMKYGPVNSDVNQGFDLLYDCTKIQNPYSIAALKPLTGLDSPVRRYVMNDERSEAILEHLMENVKLSYPGQVKAGLLVGLFCTGGRHRSVALAMEAATLMLKEGHTVEITLRDAKRWA